MDLDAYFERIGWHGPRSATRDVLVGVVGHHVRAIPFENFDVLLGRPVRLGVEDVMAKLVRARRGGYCYEHATLVAAALRELGFVVHGHSARVVMVTPRDRAPRTHMFLTVGDDVLDPGFGGHAPMVPVPLDGRPAAEHRIVREGSEHVLQVGTQRLWTSSLERDLPIDFEMANHFTSTHPASPFVQRIMARAFAPDGQVTIANREVTRVRHGATETLQLADRTALRAVVAEHFGFDLPELEAVRVPSIPEWA
jgi:N-hydroxyarylamine O-acetyltransferase